MPTEANIELDQNELKILENIGIIQPGYTLDDAIETALLLRLDLANSADGIDDAMRKVKLACEGLGPQLNLTADAEVNSREKTDISNLQFNRGSYNAGIEADLPLDRKAQRNAYRKAIIGLQQQQRQYDDDMEKVKLDVRDAYRQLEAAAERYDIQKNSLQLAQKRVESTSMLLEQGRAQTRDLLDSQDALLAAQNSVTAALIEHLIAKLSFFRDIGLLQVRPDGMWQQPEQTPVGQAENEN